MATPTNDREKFAEKLLKEWEHIEDEVLIKEVATKGKYINLLLQFLVKRSGKPLTDVKQYFNDEVDKYVHRLLTNRQVHKAELVLKNSGRKSQALFYEFVQSTSQEHIDDDIKERVILEHLQNCDNNFDVIREEYDYYLLVLRLAASNKTLRRQFEDEIHVFTLESLLRKSVEFRKLMAVTTCLHCKNAILVEKLDKHITWSYLWRSEQFQYIIKWLNLLYDSKCPSISDLDGGQKEPCFDVAIRNLFSSWDIEPEMFASVQNDPRMDECILNSFAQNGMIVHCEKDSIVAMLQRILTTCSFETNKNWLVTDKHLQKMIRLIFEQDQLVLLLHNIFSTELIGKVAPEFQKIADEIDLCTTIKQEDFETKRSVAIVSEKCSEYIIKTSDVDFYSKFPHVYLMEQLLKDVSPMELANSKGSLEILGKISVTNLFLRKLRTTNAINDYDVTLDEMLQLKNIDLKVIKAEAIATNGDTTDDLTTFANQKSNDELISFSNQCLNQKYGQSTVLSYADYVKQYRSAYAVYKFFVNQLNIYSQISHAQIQIACGAISEIAINNLDDNEMVAHCVSFIEMLGINSQILRAHIKCCRIIKENAGDDFNLSCCFNEEHVIKQTENIFLQQIKNCETLDELFDVNKFEPLKLLCKARKSDLPLSFLKEAAKRSNWFQFLLFAAYHNYSIRSIIDVCQMECFKNRNIGLNMGRALKEIIVEDEMPRRTNSFSYREHKRKILNKNDTNLLITANNRHISNSMNYMEKLATTKLLSCQQFLNINDDMDIFAVILICTCELRSADEPELSLTVIRDIMKNPDIYQPCTHLNLVRYAFKMKWPILSILAATVNESAVDYCWIIWLIISTEQTEMQFDIEEYGDLVQYIITYCVQENHVRTLHQSFRIFYPDSKFTLFTQFLSETSRYQFTTKTSALLMDFLYELDEETVSINSLVPFSNDHMLRFVSTLLVEYVKRSFDSMEHSQQLLDTIAASGISNRTDTIDFSTIAAINQIIRFTKVRLNIDEMLCRLPSDTNNGERGGGGGAVVETEAEMEQSTLLQNEYIRISDELIAEKQFKCAIEMADLLSLSKDTIIYEQWIHQFENEERFDFESCDQGISQHSISPLVLINFLLFVSGKLDYTDIKKYLVLKKILNAIKKHHLYPNEVIPRDRIECEMYKCILKNDSNIDEIEMYNSEYFEAIMMTERGVLYKSFLDLKDLAGVDRLTVVAKDQLKKQETERLNKLMNRLLDQGDVVQALRLQGIFNHRTIDLHYLVFCMALAESLANLYDLSTEQKQMLNAGLKQAASKFNRRTLRLKRMNTSCSTSTSSSPVGKTYLDSEPTRVDFEEIPSGEKQDLLDAIQSLASRVKYGFKLVQRIAMVFRAAMHLEKEYLDVLQTKDPYILLQNAMDDPCVNRLLVMSDIMTSMQMTATEIANFIAEQISRAIIKSRFYLLHSLTSHSFGQNFLWDYDLDKDFHLFLELCPSTSASLLGHNLLRFCDALKIYRKFDSVKNAEPDLTAYSNADELRETFNSLWTIMENQVLSYKKQNTITVELLIKAHDCFVYECSMEGIAFVLQRCKAITATLAAAKSWRLIVKLLMGVGRYRDMYYCFEILMKNGQFECLLGQFDEERVTGFKDAIISYLREHHPDDKENYRLAALHFQMYQELAQISESEARTIVENELKKYEKRSEDEISIASMSSTKSNADQFSDASSSTLNFNENLSLAIASGVTFLVCSKSLLESLTSAIDAYANSADNYLLENKLVLAQRAASNAELVAMQIHLVRHTLEYGKPNCLCVLNIRSESVFRYLVNNELNIPQSLMLSRAYPYEITWTESIFSQFVLQGKDDYIIEYCVRMELSDDMIENLVKNFLQLQSSATSKMEKAISIILEMVQSVTLRYKLASLLCDKRGIAGLINGDCLYYLKDTNYGRNETL
ncbi:spatacsin [Sitodiplosis mosellana]|uniref:spatacsin n=1 Tax=Sitodiplosis mosellana TaxID=263140 RepID=UPI0024453707|nr:spatacsin [Sitodiplosis mosellana]